MADPIKRPASANILVRHIRFVAEPVPGFDVLKEFREPCRKLAVCRHIAPEEFVSPANGTVSADEFYCVFLPAGHAVSHEWRKWTEEWITSQDKTAETLISMVVQGDRIYWSPGRVLINGSPERMDGFFDGLLDFSFYEAELRRLEKEVDTGLENAEKDIPLTHQVDESAVKRWPHVNAMTKAVTLCRIRYVRLETRLEKAAAASKGPSRRAVAELLNNADVSDRLEYLDDRLEILEDLYEVANDRIAEYSYFSREYRVEIWIVFVLALEIAALLWEIALIYHH